LRVPPVGVLFPGLDVSPLRFLLSRFARLVLGPALTFRFAGQCRLLPLPVRTPAPPRIRHP
jgi:hypothetical protein